MTLSSNPYDDVTEVAHFRGACLEEDIATAARDYYRPLTEAELSEIKAAMVKIFISTNRSDVWLTANEVLTLYATHSHD